jgi:hypothetical protein
MHDKVDKLALYCQGMKRLAYTLFTSLCLGFTAQATDIAALSKTEILREADRCDMLGQKEITFLTSKAFKDIYQDLAKNRQLITQSLQQRYACYQDVLKALEAYLSLQQKAMSQQPLDVPALQQWQIDTGLRDTFVLRQTISQELLLNILRDLERTPPEADYLQESEKTKALLQQDFLTLLDHTKRQLNFDDQQLWLGTPDAQTVMKTKLALASNLLSQAQAVYESDANTAVITARLATLLSAVPGHIYEILAWQSAQPKPDKKVMEALAPLVAEAEGLLEKIPQTSPEALYEGISQLQDHILQLQQGGTP